MIWLDIFYGNLIMKTMWNWLKATRQWIFRIEAFSEKMLSKWFKLSKKQTLTSVKETVNIFETKNSLERNGDHPVKSDFKEVIQPKKS